MQDYEERDGFFSRIVRFFSGSAKEEEDGFEEPSLDDYPTPKKRWSLRLYSRKDVPIYRKEIVNFEEEIEEAAIRLRQGYIVIVNLEKANDETARRVVDFLSGVAFGIRGSHEKIGTKVFLFAPSGYSIY
jgi:cell division inhibitor SepF